MSPSLTLELTITRLLELVRRIRQYVDSRDASNLTPRNPMGSSVAGDTDDTLRISSDQLPIG